MRDWATAVRPPGFGGSWRRAFEPALRWAYALPVALVFVGSIRSVLAECARVSRVGDVALVGLGLAQVVVVILAMVGFSRWWSDLILTTLTAVFLAMFLAGQPPGAWDVEWWPNAAVIAVQAWVLAFGGHWRWPLGGAACAVYATLRMVATVRSGDPVRLGLPDVVSGIEMALVIVLGVQAARQIARHCDQVEHQRTEAMLHERRRHSAESANREVARFLHDEVIHALRLVADRPVGVAPRDIRRQARAAAVGLRDGVPERADTDSAGLRARLAELGAHLGLSVSVTGRAAWAPASVVDALVRAAAEALRNVARHAGTDRARVRIEPRDGGTAVLVSDDGAGFSPVSRTLGHGLRTSVIGAMKEVGGVARIHSSPAGTTVELAWHPADVDTRVAATWRELTKAVNPFVVPIIIGSSVLGLLVAPDLPRPWLGLLGLLVVTLGGVTALSRDGRRLSNARVVSLLGIALFGLVTNVLAVDPGTRNGFHLFMAGAIGPLLMLTVIHWPMRASVPAVFGVWGVLVGLGMWRFGIDAMTGPLVGALTSPVIAVAVIGAKHVLQRVGRRILATQDETARSLVRAEYAASRQDVRDTRLRRIAVEVLPFLDAVAVGEVNPQERAVARRAAVLEAGVRDEIRPVGVPREINDAVAAARRRGWDLEVRITRADLDSLQTELLALLSALDQDGSTSGRAVLSAVTGAAIVVADPAAASLAQWHEQADMVVEEEATWVRLTARAPVASRARSAS